MGKGRSPGPRGLRNDAAFFNAELLRDRRIVEAAADEAEDLAPTRRKIAHAFGIALLAGGTPERTYPNTRSPYSMPWGSGVAIARA